MSFYNTYRPKTFEEIDNEQVRTLVTSLLSKKKEQLPHAFFLTGPRGIGKTTAARIIAKLFNCLQPKPTGEPCGMCDLCVRIGQGNAIDVLEMDAASNTGVDNIRDLKDKIMLAPSQAKWKVYIIDEVHMLSTGAFNALLKTLEEPPANTVFILATTDPHKVPDTIQSRCVLLQFKKPELKEIVAALNRIIAAEKITADQDSLTLIAETADGSFRDATKLLEQVSLASKSITVDTVKGLLSLPLDSVLFSFIEMLQKKDTSGLIQSIDQMNKEGIDIRQFYTQVLKNLQKVLINHVTGTHTSVWTIPQLSSLIGILLTAYGNIRGSVLPDLALELAVLEYCSEKIAIPQPVPQVPQIQQPKPASVSQIRSEPAKPIAVSTPEPKLDPPETPEIAHPQENSPAVTTQTAEAITTPAVVIDPGSLTTQRLKDHWNDIIVEIRNYNHSVSGVLRSTRPKSVENGIVTIEAFYTFHKDKLSETKAIEAMVSTIKKLFGEKVSIQIVLGKK